MCNNQSVLQWKKILAQMKTKTDQVSGKQEEGKLGANFQEILYKMKVSDMS